MATTVTPTMIKELRERTAAGLMDCKKALVETDGDMDKAIEYLRKKGLAAAAKKAGRLASEGAVTAYIHSNNRVGVLLEVNCETDFVARTEQFQEFVHDVALHIAAMKPQFVNIEEIPQEYIDSERAIYIEQAKDVPEKAREKAVEGKLNKQLRSLCLLEQEFVKDGAEKKPRTIEELRVETASGLGENITIRRFSLFELGQ